MTLSRKFVPARWLGCNTAVSRPSTGILQRYARMVSSELPSAPSYTLHAVDCAVLGWVKPTDTARVLAGFTHPNKRLKFARPRYSPPPRRVNPDHSCQPKP